MPAVPESAVASQLGAQGILLLMKELGHSYRSEGLPDGGMEFVDLTDPVIVHGYPATAEFYYGTLQRLEWEAERQTQATIFHNPVEATLEGVLQAKTREKLPTALASLVADLLGLHLDENGDTIPGKSKLGVTFDPTPGRGWVVLYLLPLPLAADCQIGAYLLIPQWEKVPEVRAIRQARERQEAMQYFTQRREES